MLVRLVLWVSWVALTAMPGASLRAADTGTRTVQLVYESDTRGYYLPCG